MMNSANIASAILLQKDNLNVSAIAGYESGYEVGKQEGIEEGAKEERERLQYLDAKILERKSQIESSLRGEVSISERTRGMIIAFLEVREMIQITRQPGQKQERDSE